MRRLSVLMTGVAMLVLSAGGCGSTGGAGGDDALVLQFVQWNSTGITQADQVGESNADVDVVQDICNSTTGTPTAEPFTQTVINAVFRNNEGSDILLQGYSTEIGDPRLSQANISNPLSTSITGGRCSTTNAPCVTAADCGVGAVGALSTCDHSETTVSGIVLFDFLGKAVVYTVSLEHPEVLGQATPMKVTFFGSDPNRSFQVSASYSVTFADFDNCTTSSGGGAGGS
jgi:hypothetical protein